MMSEIEYNKRLSEIYDKCNKEVSEARVRRFTGAEKLRVDYDKEVEEARARKVAAANGLRKELNDSRGKKS